MKELTPAPTVKMLEAHIEGLRKELAQKEQELEMRKRDRVRHFFEELFELEEREGVYLEERFDDEGGYSIAIVEQKPVARPERRLRPRVALDEATTPISFWRFSRGSRS